MRADNTAHLVTAAKRRHDLARSKTIQPIRELDTAGTHITFELVAQKAQVSRSWLYTQPDIKTEIQRLRDLGHRAPATSLPAHHRSSNASLLGRLEAAQAENSPKTTNASATSSRTPSASYGRPGSFAKSPNLHEPGHHVA